jgi:transposase InsO family protein
MFYNTRRRHGYNDQQSPVEYERLYLMRLQGV